MSFLKSKLSQKKESVAPKRLGLRYNPPTISNFLKPVIIQA